MEKGDEETEIKQMRREEDPGGEDREAQRREEGISRM